MIDSTINDAKTIAGSGKDMILAGRYRIIRRLGQVNLELDSKAISSKLDQGGGCSQYRDAEILLRT